jgi:hypothetical protein
VWEGRAGRGEGAVSESLSCLRLVGSVLGRHFGRGSSLQLPRVLGYWGAGAERGEVR